MPILQQVIRSYDLHFAHVRTASGSIVTHSRTRFIHLRFGDNPANLSLFILSFVNDPQSASTGTLTKLPNGSYRLTALIPVAEFAAYYDVLRNEQPITLWVDYATEPATNQSVDLNQFSINTGTEPLGEGPKDTSV